MFLVYKCFTEGNMTCFKKENLKIEICTTYGVVKRGGTKQGFFFHPHLFKHIVLLYPSTLKSCVYFPFLCLKKKKLRVLGPEMLFFA